MRNLKDQFVELITAAASGNLYHIFMGIPTTSIAVKEFADKLAEIDEEYGRQALLAETMPKIVCLCGSTRFMETFFEEGWRETLEGKIVLSVGVCKHAEDHGGEALGKEVADKLDQLHLRKIDLADEVLILNVGGYIGESTRLEFEYAMVEGKNIRMLEGKWLYCECLKAEPRVTDCAICENRGYIVEKPGE